MSKYVTAILLMLNMMLTMYTFATVSQIKDKLVYNMDKVRHQYIEDVQFYYKRGCMDGTKYPPEYRTNAFSKNSPPIWCGNKTDHMQHNFQEDLYRLGR